MAKAKATHLELFQKELGKHVPKNSCVVNAPSIPYWNSTGSILLDMETRGGLTPCGYPGGKFVEFFGENGCGKTAMGCLAMREVQREGGLAVLITPEGIDPVWLEQTFGIVTNDPNRFICVEPHSLEAALGAIYATVRAFFDKAIRIVILLDSLSVLTTAGESMNERALDEGASAAAAARKCHEFFRGGILYFLSGSMITPIIIRHLTSSPRPYDGDKTTHGSSLDYSAWLRFKFTRKKLVNSKKQQVGWWVTVRCKKSKIGGWYDWSHALPYYFNHGFDIGMEYVSWLIDNVEGYAVDSNGRVRIFDQNAYPSFWREKFHTDEGFRDELTTLVQEKWLELNA